MQGTNNSRIGMRGTRRQIDDGGWEFKKKDGRGSKGRNSQKQAIRSTRRQSFYESQESHTDNYERNYDY